MKLGQKQAASIRDATHRMNIWVGAIRSGKTFASLFRWFKFIGKEAPDMHGELIMTGKTHSTLFRNVIRPMQDLLGDQMHFSHYKQTIDLWGEKIFLFGAHDAAAESIIRGMTVKGAYQDEMTVSPMSYFKMTLGRMSVTNAKFFGTTNTDSPHHELKVNYLDRAGDLDLIHYRFSLDDNASLSAAYKANIRKEYTGLWYRRFILGEWVAAEGSIYDFFNYNLHTMPSERLPKARMKFIGCDYGTGAPTCFIMFGHNPNTRPKVWAIKEYFYDSKRAGRQKTDAEYAKDMLDFIGDEKIDSVYIDPSASSFIAQLRQPKQQGGAGLGCIIPAKNDIIAGIRTQARMLHSGEYKICRDCTRTIKDYDGYCWDEKQQKRGIDAPMAGESEHTKDSERYPLYTLFSHDLYTATAGRVAF